MTLSVRRHLCPEMEPQFAVCFDGRLRSELEASGAPVHQLGGARLRSPASVWRARRRLLGILERDEPHVVVCHSAWCQAVFGPAARRAGTPTVQWLHNRTRGRQLVERLARLVPPNLLLCVSRSTAETAASLYPRVRAEVCYAPLTTDPAQFQNADRLAVRAELATPSDDVVVIQVSRMEAWKGYREHLQALARIRDVQGWTCWFAGGAERREEVRYLDSIRELASRLGIAERIRFLGRRSDVPRLLTAADIFCQPNLDTEGFSIAFTEAFQARLPVITSAIGGALELVDDSCGVLLPPGDVQALAGALRALIGDAERRRALGTAGQARLMELCDPGRQLAEVARLLASVAALAQESRRRR